MFRKFLTKVKKGAVVSRAVFELLGENSFSHLDIIIFNDDTLQNPPLSKVKRQWNMDKYLPGKANFTRRTDSETIKYVLNLPMPGRHTGLNALAVFCVMDLIRSIDNNTTQYIEHFKGVWRRSDFAGQNSNGAKIYDDYAHNVEKIISSIKTAGEEGDRVITIFQPHGFKPLEFMQQPLLEELETELSDNGIFILLPVYYAGGSASFTPTSEEVGKYYIANGTKQYRYFHSRNALKKYITKVSTSKDVVLIMGARDNSLSELASEIAHSNGTA